MKVMFVGNDPQAADKVNLAARLRWPEATVVTAGEDETGLEELERQAPDVLMFQPQPTVRPVNRFIEEVRTFSDVPLIVLQPPEGGDSMEEITALESGGRRLHKKLSRHHRRRLQAGGARPARQEDRGHR